MASKSSKKTIFPLVEENSKNSSGFPYNKSNSKNSNNKITLSNKSNLKLEEDDNSLNTANFTTDDLNSEKDQNIEISLPTKPRILSKKDYEKYKEKLKEKTMRLELEQMSNETDRLKQKYEEKRSHLHSFDNEPQFQLMLKTVIKKLKYFLVEGGLLTLFNSLLYFYVTNKKAGVALASFILSITEIYMDIILFISLKFRLLNDPELSKAFRIFVVIEYLLLFSSFITTLLAVFISYEYFQEINDFGPKVMMYIFLLIIVLIFIFVFKYCFSFFYESILILVKKKTEYSILILNEKRNRSDINFNTNVSTMSNNLTSEVLNNSSNIFKIDNNLNNSDNSDKKEEEKYNTINFFDKFHYSITSSRTKDY